MTIAGSRSETRSSARPAIRRLPVFCRCHTASRRSMRSTSASSSAIRPCRARDRWTLSISITLNSMSCEAGATMLTGMLWILRMSVPELRCDLDCTFR